MILTVGSTPNDEGPLYKAELIHRRAPWKTKEAVELATLEWVHWFNNHRLHTGLSYQTPVEHENAYYSQINTEQQPLPGELALH